MSARFTFAAAFDAHVLVVGAAAISRFAATFFLFGGFLAYTAVTVWRSGEEEPDPEGNALAGRQGFVRIKLVNDAQFGEKNEVDDYIVPKLKPLAETKAAPKPKPAPAAPAQDRADDVPF